MLALLASIIFVKVLVVTGPDRSLTPEKALRTYKQCESVLNSALPVRFRLRQLRSVQYSPKIGRSLGNEWLIFFNHTVTLNKFASSNYTPDGYVRTPHLIFYPALTDGNKYYYAGYSTTWDSMLTTHTLSMVFGSDIDTRGMQRPHMTAIITCHELGHAIGMRHDSSNNNIMHPGPEDNAGMLQFNPRAIREACTFLYTYLRDQWQSVTGSVNRPSGRMRKRLKTERRSEMIQRACRGVMLDRTGSTSAPHT